MSITRYKTFTDGEVLTAADLNGMQDQVIDNEQDVGSPRTEAFDLDGQRLIMSADGNTSAIASTASKVDLRLNSQDLFDFDGTAVAPVNGMSFVAAATGQATVIQAKGSDASVTLSVRAKGTGGQIGLRVNSFETLVLLSGSGTPVNGIQAFSAPTGSPAELRTTGSDTNVGLKITPKGTGAITLDADPTGVGVDIDGAPLVLDADGDTSLRETSDDVLALKMQGMDAFIFDGDVASPVNGLTLRSSATTVDPAIAGHGTDAIVNVRLTPKSTGVAASAGGWAVDGATNLTWRWTGSSTSVLLQENTGSATAPTWTTRNTFLTGVGVPKGTALLASSSPSSAASVDLTSVITSLFDIYDIEFYLLPATDSVSLWLRVSTNNGSSWESGAVYSSQYLDMSGATITAASGTTGNAMEICRSNVGNNAPFEGVFGTIRIHSLGSGSGYPQTTSCSWRGELIDAAGLSRTLQGSGGRVGVNAINAVQLLFESGNIADGEVRIYGLPK